MFELEQTQTNGHTAVRENHMHNIPAPEAKTRCKPRKKTEGFEVVDRPPLVQAMN